ncbi:hypothetical protein AKJ40_01095 [candidate division MSBL1 archaeon SCGC-AAA259M10]|uniref:DUF357 domain-containing protein n=3 Tax=candidate division MSBL1 TaxID=215777 RepID=A0A656YZS6_9EURY|nr:hypothetical protein AKJ61_03875 [candidate division MSBL1 archaeon SCGC-AAA259B11]KXA98479.1 hypothetical protein AKJ39_01970 [candidate division MSBL1 archaeon SCGC-AAA259J03]KXB00581.1 hypothetical protein AKJ40_01095 [candidate division MSBL1 archaeon SCGC-AAA259M10]
MLRNELENKIEKWSHKLDEKLNRIRAVDDHGERILENAEAYRRDSDHFFENDELIESFESLIWAWAFLEIGENLNHLATIDE